MGFDFRLVHLTDKGNGIVTRLREGTQLVGRNPTCDIHFMDDSISRRHARVEVSNGTVRIVDLQSRNGTFVEGQRVEESFVLPDQVVTLGEENFQLILVTEPEDPNQYDDQTVQLSDDDLERAEKHPLIQELSEAEIRVLRELVTGAKEQQIADKLLLAKSTVHNHAKRIYSVLKVHSRAELVRKIVELGAF